ncbi:hypothetical protein NP493_480g01020 [Ridgeia piscesae]|uniref:DNA repair endonuclease XPF n=1 Tax=Ridgeia piscesae TaxID=27915 RepID=A0AAD9NRD6_RIDPI|nr:hypothetical protein NP493_480g01020 [Ridgeia piscesae]
MLEYENQIFLDAFHDDGLLVLARGLGIERIFLNFLKLHCDPGNLVLVLNTAAYEEEYFIEQLMKDGERPLPKVITSEYNANDRHTVYMEGGVLFVTSRILVVDLLTNRVPIEHVSGILVYNAHKIIESCQEAFILRLYRERNKAFSDRAQAFTMGFCHVERVMRNLFVRRLYLWPRFQALIVDVVELQVEMTAAMRACQTALLDLIDGCVKELKLGNTRLDTDEITVENALTHTFDKIVRIYLDPVWHQLSQKTKQLVADIKMLRHFVEYVLYLTQCDCVSFYNLVNSVSMPRVECLVHPPHLAPGRQQRKLSRQRPQWAALRDVLDEIDEENKRLATEDQPQQRVLVVAVDDRTCSQIKQYLCDGGQATLTRLLEKTQNMRQGSDQYQVMERRPGHVTRALEKTQNMRQGSDQRMKPKRGSAKSKTTTSDNSMTLTQMVDIDKGKEETADNEKKEGAASAFTVDSLDAYCGVLTCPLTMLHPLHGLSDPNSLLHTLYQLQPSFVVLYDADVTFVRQLEVFRATRPTMSLRVYFLMYTGSTEEQRYLTALRKEKVAFEYLIREKASMVVPEERDGKLEEDPNLGRDATPANVTTSTRSGGKKQTLTRKVIVDMREFRSELPSLIHRRGIDIEPVTLEVGDYILTPDICVERKSVSDLIGSLNNGRLYNQAVAMCRHYVRPLLLIEFDPNKSFALQDRHSQEINSQDVTSRLTLLTLHFPRLRILWCQSAYATAELFDELKQGRDEPDASTAMTITGDSDTDLECGKYNHGPQNMLLKMPGVNSKNVFAIMNHVKSLAELVTFSLEQLTQILGSAPHAQQLHQFLHRADSGAAGTTHAAGGKPATGKAVTSRFASKRTALREKGPTLSKAPLVKVTRQTKKS